MARTPPPATLHQILQSTCLQWKDNLTAAILAQPGPFDCEAHISNFLQSLEKGRTTQPCPSEERGIFRKRFTPPFAVLFFSRERKARSQKTEVSDSETPTQLNLGRGEDDFETLKQLNASRDERGFETLTQLNASRDERGLQTWEQLSASTDKHDSGILERRSVVDGAHSHGNPNPSIPELQLLQIQLEHTALASTGPVSKEELGRATWTFLHTLAAQFPDRPSRQQQRDAKELMAILSRLYPCKECADHFKEVLKVNPVQAGSGVELAQWMCKVHNVVNRSLGKPTFPCHRVDARWGAMNCDEGACNLQGRMH